MGGFGGLIEKLGELAETGEELSKSGEFKDAGGKLRGVYGINVRTALGDSGETELKIEPFGNVRRGHGDQPRARMSANRWSIFMKKTTMSWSWSNFQASPRKMSMSRPTVYWNSRPNAAKRRTARKSNCRRVAWRTNDLGMQQRTLLQVRFTR